MMFQVGLISQTGSVYLTICVTMERYLAVCHPLKAKYLCTYGRAKLYVLLTVLFSIGKSTNLVQQSHSQHQHCHQDRLPLRCVKNEIRLYINLVTTNSDCQLYAITLFNLKNLMKNQDMFQIEKELNHCSMKSLFGLEKCRNVTIISYQATICQDSGR